MDETFTDAQKVLVNLGELDADGQQVLEMLDRYADISATQWAEIEECFVTKDLGQGLSLLDDLNMPGLSSSFWPAFVTFMERPWFTRIWVLQEYILARSAQFMIGTALREGDSLSTACQRAHSHIGAIYSYPQYYNVETDAASMEKRRTVYLGLQHIHRRLTRPFTALSHMTIYRASRGVHRPLPELLELSCKLLEATNRQDKVYALYGLLGKYSMKDEVRVDYIEKCSQTSVRLSRYLLANGHGMFILCNSVGLQQSITSWALNLHDRRRYACPVSWVDAWNIGCSPEANDSASLQFRTSLDTDSLWVSGCVVGKVENISDKIPSQSDLDDVDGPNPFEKWFLEVFHFFDEIKGSFSCPEAQLRQTCWATMIMNTTVTDETTSAVETSIEGVEHGQRMLDSVDFVRLLVWRKFIGELSADDGLDPGDHAAQVLGDHARWGASLKFGAGRRLAMLSRADATTTMSLVPEETQPGDIACRFVGMPMPFILRPVGSYYRLVGFCYVHGIALETIQENSVDQDEFEIR